MLQLLEFGRRVEAELVGELGAIGLDRPECLGVAAGSVQRECELDPASFPPGFVRDSLLQGTDDLGVPARLEERREPVLDR